MATGGYRRLIAPGDCVPDDTTHYLSDVTVLHAYDGFCFVLTWKAYLIGPTIAAPPVYTHTQTHSFYHAN